jgi:hypothetical protein
MNLRALLCIHHISSAYKPPILDEKKHGEFVDSDTHSFSWFLSPHPLSTTQCNSRLAAAISNQFPSIC